MSTHTIFKHYKHTIITAFTIVSLIGLSAMSAKASSKADRTVRYQMTIDGYDAGTSEHRWIRSPKGIELHSTDISDSFGYSYSLKAEFLWENGLLRSLSYTEDDDGKKTVLHGLAEKGQFTIVELEGTRETRRDDFQLADFDLIYEGLAAHIDQSGFPEKGLEVRMLDSATREIVVGKITMDGTERITQGPHSFDCKKVRFNSDDFTSTLWIATDALGSFVAKETSESELGKVLLELQGYSITGATSVK